MNGIFCANFASSRQSWKACLSVWHGRCYTPHALDHFYHHIPTDEDGFDWRPAEDSLRYKQGRDGDHLVTPFQCDTCVFRNLMQRDPLPDVHRDALLQCCIRRANLDAVWGREPNTVGGNLRAVKQMIRLWEKVGMPPQFPPLGPFPVKDSLGMGVAIAMLLKSLEPGRYHNTYQQFETIRKLRAGFSNVYMTSVEGVLSLRTVGGDRAKHHLTHSPTQSKWFELFSQGCIRRMGQDVRQDWAITLQAMHGLQQLLEDEWAETQDHLQRETIVSIGAYSLIAFCGSFRGAEVFLTDLQGLRKYIKEDPERSRDHVIIPLLGRFKGELHERYHLAPLAATTDSGLEVRRWVERLVQFREEVGRVRGPAFCDQLGGIARSKDYELAIIERLQVVQQMHPGAIPQDVELYEHFGVSRSFRRGSTSTARTRGVTDKLVDLINRWRKFEGARGRRPALSMHDHYSDIAILIPELVKYSKAL